MNNYLASTSDDEDLAISISYLQGPVREWWIVHKETEVGRNVTSWNSIEDAAIALFETLKRGRILAISLERGNS